MKIKHFSLVAKDYTKLRDFYKDLLHLELDFDDKENAYCQFNLDGDLKIDFEGTKAVTNELPDLKKKIKLLVRIEVDNADKAYKEIKIGRKLLSEPVTRPWGMRNFYLLDPEDNLIEVYQKL
mgnify:CR=1 FL=1